MYTVIKASDNSGARLLNCIKIKNKSRKQVGLLGDLIIVSIKRAIPRKKVKKGEIHSAILIRTKKEIKRRSGFMLYLLYNYAVLINAKQMPIGTRIFGPVTYELRTRKYFKLIALAPRIL